MCWMHLRNEHIKMSKANKGLSATGSDGVWLSYLNRCSNGITTTNRCQIWSSIVWVSMLEIYVTVFLPPANGVTKVMFSVVSVCQSFCPPPCNPLPSDMFKLVQLGPYCTRYSTEMPSCILTARNGVGARLYFQRLLWFCPWGAICVVATGHVWLLGGMRGCWGACVVVGGVHGCRGACMVARGHAWLQGGMCGCQGVCVVLGGMCGCEGHAWLQGGCV